MDVMPGPGLPLEPEPFPGVNAPLLVGGPVLKARFHRPSLPSVLTRARLTPLLLRSMPPGTGGDTVVLVPPPAELAGASSAPLRSRWLIAACGALCIPPLASTAALPAIPEALGPLTLAPRLRAARSAAAKAAPKPSGAAKPPMCAGDQSSESRGPSSKSTSAVSRTTRDMLRLISAAF